MRGPLRIREPRGVIAADEATVLLQPFVGVPVGAADTSMDRLVIAVATDPMHLLVIAGPVMIASGNEIPGRPVCLCHTPGSAEALAAIAEISGRAITGVAVSPAGTLRLDLGDGFIVIEADSRYEAWEIRGMDGGLLACLPGGAVSLWTPATEEIPAPR